MKAVSFIWFEADLLVPGYPAIKLGQFDDENKAHEMIETVSMYFPSAFSANLYLKSADKDGNVGTVFHITVPLDKKEKKQ